MSWKKHFSPVQIDQISGIVSPIHGSGRPGPARLNYSSYLPDVYTGAPNRIERYMQYDTMDMDSEVNAALDILAEFCTQMNKQNNTPFQVQYRDEATNTETKILKEYLQQWAKLQKFETRMFRIARNLFKYGDLFFIRDPETNKWFYIDPGKVTKIIVNESEGKKPEQYVIRDLNINLMHLVTTQINPNTQNMQPGGAAFISGGAGARGMTGAYPQQVGTRFSLNNNEYAIDADHVVHISLSEGLDNLYPFGQSLLENVFKVYKQKELLEDAIIIYRVQRAPERRVFYIDVGNMPSHLAMGYVERVKNEIHQRRIPSSTGGGTSVIDSSYNPLCLDLSTRIPLLDGRTLPLTDIIDEFKQGKQNWVYSCDPATGKIVPGVIDWAGITKTDAEVIELTLDNGETLICTPDHKIPVFGKGFVEAKDLTADDSLISFNIREKAISGGKTNKYQQVWDHESKKWIWTHRIVGEFFRTISKHQEFTYLTENGNKPKTVIHHIDNNRYNNDPRNLTYMNKQDHILYHSAQKKEFWETMSDEFRATMTEKISNTLKEKWKNMSEKERLEKLWNIRAAQQKSVWLRQHDTETKERYKQNMSASRKKYLQNHPDMMIQLKKNLESRIKIKNQELNLTFDMLQIVVGIVKAGYTNKNEVLRICDTHEKLLTLVKESNNNQIDYKNAQCKIDFTKFGYSKMDRLLSKFGYKNWKHFVKEIDNFNHKIVSIRTVNSRDVGTITVDGLEKYHNYHTFAIESGIFVKNSINEDYFFPQTAEGRGSKVETLPGGTNLGEINDLQFFTNKLMRALRIPSSYLPTGPEESQTSYNDGRVGTAYIQELRFNKYCERLQTLMIEQFDKEFKLFLHNKGVNIDFNLFDLKFQTPQNFASYRQAELDNQRISTFTQMSALPFMSKRYALKRFLGLTEDEIAENERLWKEESGTDIAKGPSSNAELRSIGVSPAGIEADQLNLTEPEQGPTDELGMGGMPGAELGAPGVAAPMGSPSGAGLGATV